MNCRHCGGKAAKGDKHCVYCGRRLRLVPTWAKFVGLAVVAIAVIVPVLTNLLSDHAPSSNDPTLSVSMRDVTPANEDIPAKAIPHVKSAPPVIDGTLEEGEWGQPSFTKDLEFYIWHVQSEEVVGTGQLSGYSMNDNASLHMAIAFSTNGLEANLRPTYAKVILRFDGDNNGSLTEGEDMRQWFGSDYYDGHFDPDLSDAFGYDMYDSGAGASSGVAEDNSMVFEFRVPLNSGDPQDLAVLPETLSALWSSSIRPLVGS